MFNFKRIVARLGEYDISTTEDGKHETIRVDHAVAHKLFRRGVGINDIGLVYLVEDVEFTGEFQSFVFIFFLRIFKLKKFYLIINFLSIFFLDRIRPICLPIHGIFKNHDFAGMNPFLAGKN